MKPKKYLIFLLLASLVAILFMGSASAADTYVNGSIADDTGHTGLSWDQAFNTIQEGYNSVTDGSTVNIAPGTYTGNDNKGIYINKNITIQGAGANQTIIDLQGANYAFRIANYNNVTIKDLTIQNGNNEPNGGGAIFNYNYGNLTVENVIFKDNRAAIGGAIENYYGNLKVTNCIFTGNNATSYDEGAGGGAIYNTGNLIITGSTFTGNSAQAGGAIYTEYGTTTTINSSIFDNNTAQYGGAISNYGTLIVIGCNFNKNNATGYGGAIHSFKEQGGSILAFDAITQDVNVKYSRFVGNTAGNAGQDIYMYGSTLNAKLNWWGNNNGPETGRVTGRTGSIPGSDTYTPWLMLNIKADPTTIYTEGTSTITANVYKDSAGGDHSADAAQFFSGPEITFTTNLGKIGSDSITVPWVLGRAVRPLVANEGPGTAHVTAADGQVVSTDVTILQAPTVNAASNTVGMQETGLPIAGLILAILAVFGGLLAPKRK